jgi:adenylate kinase family enzyme
MALDIILGPPFSGKSQFARDQIAEREVAGELGVVAIDYSALYRALVPGTLDQYRDSAVKETGAMSLTSYLMEVAIRQADESNASGYILVNSPARAARIAERVGAAAPLEMDISIDDLADRIDTHLTELKRDVPRARNEGAKKRCTQAGIAYLREKYPRTRQGLRTRKVTRTSGGKWRVSGPSAAPDAAAFMRGLTPAGRTAREALVAAGDANPTPAAIFKRLLDERGTE